MANISADSVTMDNIVSATFHWADYLVFTIILLISSGVGLFYGVAGRSKNTEDFLMAGRNMNLFPVSVSLFVSFMSAISFIGDPVEIYTYGVSYWMISVGYCLALPLVAHIFAPVFYKCQLTSAYQYLKERFSVHMRTLGTVVNGVGTTVYLGIALYAPCLALSQMSGLETWHAILIIGAVCTFYTSLGGMKAVLWADTIQMAVMFGGLVVLIVLGGAKAGGATRVLQIASDGGRLDFNRFDPDPTRRSTIWTYLFGGFFRLLTPYISVQLFVQRYCTVKSIKDMKIAIYLNVLFYLVFVTLFTIIGLILYAQYHDCDPVKANVIQKKDQLVPLMVMQTLGFLPGIPGLYLSCIVSASLSTLSSGQGALATTCLKDVIEPIYHKVYRVNMREKLSMIVAVSLSVVFGLMTIAMAMLIYLTKKTTIFGLTLTLQGAFSGPIAGLFCLGILVSKATTLNAMIGGLMSVTISFWLAVGSFLDRPPPNPLDAMPLSIEGCLGNTTQSIPLLASPHGLNITTATDDSFQVNRLYGLSPPLFNGLGFILTVIIGIIAMLIERSVRNCKHGEKYPVKNRRPEEMVPFRKT